MRLPRFAHVARHHHHASALAVVAAVEHQNARLDLCHLRLCGVVIRARANAPGFAVIPGINDGAVRQSALVGRILILRGKHQRAVGHRDTLARPGQNETPLRLLHLLSNVDGLGPRFAVIIAAHEYELAGFVRLHARARAVPRTIAVAPSRRHPDGAGVAINQHRRIANAVVAPLGIVAHVHDRTRRLPSSTAVGAARHANVDVAGQIAPAAMAQIVHANQRALRRGGQAGDATGVHAPLPALPHGHTQPMREGRSRLQFVGGTVGKTQRLTRGAQSVVDVRLVREPDRQPKIIRTLHQRMIAQNSNCTTLCTGRVARRFSIGDIV